MGGPRQRACRVGLGRSAVGFPLLEGGVWHWDMERARWVEAEAGDAEREKLERGATGGWTGRGRGGRLDAGCGYRFGWPWGAG